MKQGRFLRNCHTLEKKEVRHPGYYYCKSLEQTLHPFFLEHLDQVARLGCSSLHL
uniref:Uncharacterized protein n=1 Tax=Anopheles quadriannulatus TaxID=34691 RepID=A0A182XS54_ANOQN